MSHPNPAIVSFPQAARLSAEDRVDGASSVRSSVYLASSKASSPTRTTSVLPLTSHDLQMGNSTSTAGLMHTSSDNIPRWAWLSSSILGNLLSEALTNRFLLLTSWRKPAKITIWTRVLVACGTMAVLSLGLLFLSPLLGLISMAVFSFLFIAILIGTTVRDRMQGKHDG